MKQNYIKPTITVDEVNTNYAILQLSNVTDNDANGNGTTTNLGQQGIGLDNNENGEYVETAKKRGFYSSYSDFDF